MLFSPVQTAKRKAPPQIMEPLEARKVPTGRVLAVAFQKCNSFSATETKDIQNNFETFCQRGSLAQFLGIHLPP